MPEIKEMMEEMRQDYLNAKSRKELPPRIVFTQPNNNSDYLKSTKGKTFGNGFYAVGETVDRNIDDMPPKYQHSTSPELILSDSRFLSRTLKETLKKHEKLVM